MSRRHCPFHDIIKVIVDAFLVIESAGKSAMYIFNNPAVFLGIIIQYLAFRGHCIVIYSYNKSQQEALFLKFILVKNSTCFSQTYCPSSGVLTL